MILPALIVVLCLGGFAAWFSERSSPECSALGGDYHTRH